MAKKSSWSINFELLLGNQYMNQEFPSFNIIWIDSDVGEMIIPSESFVYNPPANKYLVYDKQDYIYVLKEKDVTYYYKPKIDKKIPKTIYYRPVQKAQAKEFPDKLGWGDDEYWNMKYGLRT